MSTAEVAKRVRRTFTQEQRKEIMDQIDNRGSDVNLTVAIKDAGISAPLYYLWKKSLVEAKVVSKVKKSVVSKATPPDSSDDVDDVLNDR